MTTQEVYEGIRGWFSEPEHVLSWDEAHEQCAYRSDGGQRCAVGCQMPDDLYKRGYEGNNIQNLVEENRPLREYFAGVDIEFLMAAQQAHDDLALSNAVYGREAVDGFIGRLDLLASAYGLAVAE